MVGIETIGLKGSKRPEWLNTLLHSKFWGSCADHRDCRRNEKNQFCINCKTGLCKHCISSSSPHCVHRQLQICKYVYHDVVRLHDIEPYLDCCNIQTYKINGVKSVHLNPRPQSNKENKSRSGVICEACGKALQENPNRFCSIACKVLLVREMYKDQSHSLISFPDHEVDVLSLKENYDPEGNASEKESTITQSSSEESQAWLKSTLKPKKKLHKRKGVPNRSPLQ